MYEIACVFFKSFFSLWRSIVTHKNKFAKRNQYCDVTKRNRRSQNNPILLQQLLNNGISLHSNTVIRIMIGDIQYMPKCKQLKLKTD